MFIKSRDCICREKKESVIEAWSGQNGDSIISIDVNNSLIAIECGSTYFSTKIWFCPLCGRKMNRKVSSMKLRKS